MIIVYLLKKLSLNFLTKIWEVQIMATNTTAVSLLDCLTHNNLITNLYSTLANNRLRCFFHAMKGGGHSIPHRGKPG